MADIKDYWGVDSSPGTGWNQGGKCGSLFATMGATGTGDIPAYSADIGDRATVPAGTHPTINTGAAIAPTTPRTPWTATPATQARAAQLGFSVKGTTYFDSFAMMYGLAETATASGSVSISFWISPDDAAQGCILGSPFQTYNATVDNNGSPATQSYEVFLNFNPIAGGGIAASYAPDTTGANFAIIGSVPATAAVIPALGRQAMMPYSLGVGSSGFTPPQATISNPNYTSGSDGLFYHVMIGIHAVSGRMKATIYVNDTAICTDLAIDQDRTATLVDTYQFPFGPTTSASGTTYPANRDGAQQNSGAIIAPPNVWHIGGNFIDFFSEWTLASTNGLSLLPEGNGLWGAVTELWIAEGQYIDWSLAANRNKFHTTDILGNVYVPTDIGSQGQTPTGTKPTMYFTGIPDDFIVNRVNGVKCSVYKGTRNSLTLDGRFPGAL